MKQAIKHIVVLITLLTAALQGFTQLQHLEESFLFRSQRIYIEQASHSSIRPVYMCDVSPEVDSTLPRNLLGLSLMFRQKPAENLKAFYFEASPLFSLTGSYNTDSTAFRTGFGAGVAFKAGLGNVLGFHYDLAYIRQSLPLHEQQFADNFGVFPGTGRELNQFFPNNLHQNLRLTYRPYKEISLEAGFGKNFIGDGFRSMLLSYNSANYPYAKAVLDVWHIKYQFMVAQLKDINVPEASSWGDFTSKYAYIHYLDWQITHWLNIGGFEAVISGPQHGFDPAYLNPVIFYRPVEFSLGSVDNALLGVNAKIRITQRHQLYAQLLLDDFNVKQFAGDIKHWIHPDDNSIQWGFFGNKYAWQAGFKSFDIFGIERLSFFTEVNLARPYTYSHHNAVQNFGHFNQSLAHPLGANFIESVSGAAYSFGRFQVDARFMFAQTGLDTTGKHFGQDIYKPTMDALQNGNIPVKTYYNTVGQGLKTQILYAEITGYFYIDPRNHLAVKASLAYRKFDNQIQHQDNLYIQLGISGFVFRKDGVF
ncbi:MAG TPA: hypothetical protein PLZ52_00210 [Bacteroidales bacterium]|nr:hypothetical protein [Bacteroidales bacterium]HQL69409.1 hypothetical protein [Bacteroidales bacterium]